MRTKIALYAAWLFSTFAFLAHLIGIYSLMIKQPVFGFDFGVWLLVSISEGIIAVLAYLDAFGHRSGIATGKTFE